MSAPPVSSDAKLPEIGDLDLRRRALYHGSVAFDLGLRTALSSILTTAMAPRALTSSGGREREHLRFYAELAARGDLDAVFTRPPAVSVSATPGNGLSELDGRVEILRFESPYQALNPELRDEYAAHENNGFARAQHWRHSSGSRQTLCVIHGFGASPAAFNASFFSLKRFFAEGWDVLLYTIPFHGSRRGQWPALNGVELFSGGFARMSEALIQAVHDFRAFVDYLEAQGAPRIGVTGLSLGGYLSGTLAAVEERLDFVIPNSAVTWMPGLLESWFPANFGLGVLEHLKGIDRATIEAGLAIHSPLTWQPVVPKERLMIVGGLGDRLAPPEQSVMLWEHWDRPQISWFPGSHIIHLDRGNYLERMAELMDSPLPAAA